MCTSGTRKCDPFDQTLSHACKKGAGHETSGALVQFSINTDMSECLGLIYAKPELSCMCTYMRVSTLESIPEIGT